MKTLKKIISKGKKMKEFKIGKIVVSEEIYKEYKIEKLKNDITPR